MSFSLLLASIAKHISLTAEEAGFFTGLLQLKSLPKGSFLLREGEICRYESFVVSDCLKTYYQDENGFEQIIDFLVETWWASDLYSLLTQTPSQTNIKALEKTELLQISRDNLEVLYRRIPKFERFFRILFQNAYITQRAQINAGLSAAAAERYRLFIAKKPYAEARFTQKDIAAYLGITPQFLSALKRKLRNVKVD